MTIDVRARVVCSLGDLVSASISDDYIQGSGLVKTTGSCQINGIITPNIGEVVTFQYVKSGITRIIPRTLRVLSSFADPFRKITDVQLGCKLTYLSDLVDPIDWTAFDDPANDGLTEDDARIVAIPINASSVMDKCLQELGISANSNPLTNKFSVAQFDFGPGYVAVLSDLLVSESYCGYLDTNETLIVFPLDESAGTGPIIQSKDIIDLGGINAGQLPGEAVTVSYSTLRLKEPEINRIPDPEEPDYEEQQENIDRINWEIDTVVSSPEIYYINYSGADGSLQTQIYSSSSSTTTTTDYKIVRVRDNNKITDKEVPASRTTEERTNAISKLGNCAAKYAEIGTAFNNASIYTTTIETFSYDEYGNQVQATTTKSEPAAVVLGAATFDWVYGGQAFSASYEQIRSEYTITKNLYSGNYTQVTTSNYLRYAFTQAGQQSIAVAGETLPNTIALANIIADAAIDSGLVHANTTVRTSIKGGTTQERPKAADRINAAYAKDGDASNNWRTESSSELELALGSATAQRRIEFSLPYAPDDTFQKSVFTFFSSPSDAPEKANRYGRVQNRLLLGNRNGMSVQIAPEKLPPAPFSPIYIEAAGTIALYRVNAASWTMDATGIVASTDALFWGTAGRTA